MKFLCKKAENAQNRRTSHPMLVQSAQLTLPLRNILRISRYLRRTQYPLPKRVNGDTPLEIEDHLIGIVTSFPTENYWICYKLRGKECSGTMDICVCVVSQSVSDLTLVYVARRFGCIPV